MPLKEYFSYFFEFVTDRSKRMSARATVAILLLLAIYLADNISGFSYYYNKQRQFDHLKSISTLLQDPALAPETKTKLREIERQTINHQNVFDQASSVVKNISVISSKRSQVAIPDNPKSTGNNFWFVASSSGLYILAVLFVVPVMLLTERDTPFLKLLAVLAIFVIVMAFTVVFNYWLCSLIVPDKLFGSWTWNYVINFILQVGLAIGTTWIVNVHKKNQGIYGR